MLDQEVEELQALGVTKDLEKMTDMLKIRIFVHRHSRSPLSIEKRFN